MRFSDIPHIDQAVQNIALMMGGNPFDENETRGTMTIGDIVRDIRMRSGTKAARSIKITVH